MAIQAIDMANHPLFGYPYDTRYRTNVIANVTSAISGNVYCIVANDSWLPNLVGVIQRLDEYDGWVGDDSDIEQARNEVRLIISRIRGCMMLRQNPTNHCQLEQSTDFGLTWSLAFDYSLCQLPMTNIIIDGILGQELEDLIDEYDGAGSDIGDIFPELIYDGVNDGTLDLGLCFAIEKWVRLLCEIAIDALNEQTWIIGGSGAGLVFLTTILGTFTTFVPPLGLALIALSGIALGIYALVNGESEDTYQDEIAIAQVVCCIYENLKSQSTGNAVQASNFANALDGCSLTGNASKIGELVSIALVDTASYVTFMSFWNETLPNAGAGNIDNCLCGAWCRSLDLSEFYNIDASPGGTFQSFGELSSGKLVSTSLQYGAGGSIYATGIYMQQDLPYPVAITKVEIDYTSIEASNNDNTSEYAIAVRSDVFSEGFNDDTDYGTDKTFIYEPPSSVVINYLVADSFPGVNNIPELPSGAYAEITAIRIYGNGAEPIDIGEPC